MPTYPIGQFIEGMDSIHAEDDSVFGPIMSDRSIGPPARCVDASNVNFDDNGRPEIRDGTTQQVAATSGLATFSALGMLFYQDQGTIKKIDPDDSFSEVEVITGLNASAKVIFHEHAGTIYWTNGLANGEIDSSGSASNWGLTTAPTPTLGTTAGSLEAGDYLVAAVLEDSAGREHAADKSAVVTLNGSQAITADLSATDSDATNVRFFASSANGSALFYVGQAAPGALPVTITAVNVSDEPLRTQFFSAPIPGDGMFSFRGMLIAFKDQYLYPSFGPATHLFDLEATEARPSNILAGAGLDDGFWTVCTRGAFWTTGDTPGSWSTVQKDNRKYAAGSLVLAGSKIPRLKTYANVALFVSENGLMAGLPDGSLIPLSDDKHRLTVAGLSASIVYFENSDFDQVLFSLS